MSVKRTTYILTDTHVCILLYIVGPSVDGPGNNGLDGVAVVRTQIYRRGSIAWIATWPFRGWALVSSLQTKCQWCLNIGLNPIRLTLHNIALDLQLPAHEQRLGLGLAGDQFAKVLLAQDQRD